MLRPENQNKYLNISQHLVINNRAEYEKFLTKCCISER